MSEKVECACGLKRETCSKMHCFFDDDDDDETPVTPGSVEFRAINRKVPRQQPRNKKQANA